jgi:proteasome accessory factor A
VSAVKQLSRDIDLKAVVRQQNGSSISGLDIQEQYYRAAERTLAGLDEETDWVLHEWSDTLTLLRQDRRRLVGKVDWVTKLWLLETFIQEERIGWDDPWLASLDLEYHNVNPERGLYLGLEAEGKAWRMTGENDIEQALVAGPADTRGGVRGLCVRRFSDQVKSVQWERIQFAGGLLPRVLDMSDLFEPSEVQRCLEAFKAAVSPVDALNDWSGRKDSRS